MVDSVIADRYRLERRIGAGGMSEVWEATDADLGRKVAVKLLAFDADPARFDREARAAAGLAHANVCTLYDYGNADGRRFMVLELLPGGSLDDRLTAGHPHPDVETRRIATEIAAGLAHAHQRGVVHRDLKPANILFDAAGRAKIADFGIARTRGAAGLTEAGTVLGTAAYISPEQARGDPATPASDVYAFGVILFRMLTGRLPFDAPDALTLAAMHRDLPAPAVSELRPDAPPLLESVAAAALAKSPADRPPDGAALVAELGPFDTAAEATAVTEVVASPASRRKRLLFALAVAAVAAAGVGLAMALTLGNGTTTPPVSTSHPAPTRPAQPPSSVPTEGEPSTTAPTTTARTSSTRETTTGTTAAETTFPATALPPPTFPTTAPVTTAPATTAAPPPPPPTTTAPTTTAATTTAAAPATTTTPTDTTPTAPDTTTTPTTAPG